jgi:ABC-type lipoprotein release transport system permease subunit
VRFLVRVAWRNLWRHARRSLITAGAMAMGVALCMFMLAYSDGIYRQMFDVLVSRKLGHVQVHHPDYPKKKAVHQILPEGLAFLPRIDALPLTEVAAPRLYVYGLLASEKTSQGGQLMGIDAAREASVSGLEAYLVAGTYEVGANRALIGEGLGRTLAIGVGDELIAIVQAADGSMGNELFTVSGVVKTGSAALDQLGAVVSLDDLGRIATLEGQIHEIVILSKDPEAAQELADGVEALPGVSDKLVRAWFEADPTTAQMMKLQDTGAFVMLFFVFALASFGVLNTMLMAVFERTRELGVLRALGVTPGQLVLMVLLESAFLGGLASLGGGVLGGLLDAYIVFHGVDVSGGEGGGFEYEGVVFDPVVHGVVRPAGVAGTLAMVFLMSVLASLWPAFRASRLRPVGAMREV